MLSMYKRGDGVSAIINLVQLSNVYFGIRSDSETPLV